MEIVLTIAGSDPSGGAGIQQDLRTIESLGCYGASVITALTTQNTIGVQGVMPVPVEVVKSQLGAVLSDLDVKAIKIGQIPSAEVAKVLVDVLAVYTSKTPCPIVLDPVMISTSGRRLMSEDAIDVVVPNLFPLCSLITPNIPETETLMELPCFDASKYNLLIKGGHAEGAEMADRLRMKDGTERIYTTEKIESSNLHGTGCALSSAIAASLAQGYSLEDAVARGKGYVTEAIRQGRNLGVGHGNGPVFNPSGKLPSME
ncbi:MAG: bifunctional hydroxymethylpyrimidine kinase/phosphomethylpyrimidine kinase [Prevotellaceae bacterium]|nr:bifunctional hydroxymethylpyrimidine kinase/phosphomethylpyrimidine kinase [Prevotellaceae bacterium]